MYEAFLATVTCFAGNFAPRGWALCNGQILSIAQNTALFSLLGTTYGGNGQTTFGLPNLMGRAPIGPGAGPGLGTYTIGESGGATSVTLSIANLPAHAHSGPMPVNMPCNSAYGNEMVPDGFYPAGNFSAFAAAPTAGVTMNAPAYSNVNMNMAGGSQPFSIMPPYLCINYIICLEGIFPSRN
jgi:microcystin-dependent protein